MLAFRLNGNGVVAKHVQMPLGVGLLEQLAAFCRRRNGIEHAGVGDARLRVVGDKLVSICRNTNAWITRGSGHKSLSVSRKIALSKFCLHKRLDPVKSFP